MNKNELVKSVSLTFNRIGFQLQKKSPEILVAVGVVGVVASAVMACKATPKACKVAEKNAQQLDTIHTADESGVTNAGEVYTKEDARRDMIQVYTQTGISYVKLYAPAVLLGAASITCILSSHHILKKRNVALAAAYTALDRNFKDYRDRVLDRFGEQVEKELRYNIKAKEIETTVTNEKGKEKKVKETVNVADEGWDPSKYSEYARIFDETHRAYMKDVEQNRFYLMARQAQANDRLKSRGHLFLNEVYEMLGFPLTKAGAVVGWIYDPKNPIGDNFVDFGMFEVCRDKAVDFVNGYERSFILDFNVVGDITDALASHQTL